MRRGEIRWLEHEEDGRRPALVLTREEAIPVLRKVTIAYLTRTVRNIPTEVRLGPEDGMPEECAVTLDNLRTVSQVLLGDPIASLAGKRMDEVCLALAVAHGCR